MHLCRCLDCDHWSGTKYSEWVICPYVVADLCPSILEFENTFGWKLSVPFDPHDIKYFPEWFRINKFIKSIDFPHDVRRVVVREPDLVLIFQNSVVIGEKQLNAERIYFYVNRYRKSHCTYFKERREYD